MPYITTDRIKEIREQIKKEFPGFKFSITRRHHSTVVISILEGAINFESWSVNHFYIKDHFKGEAQSMLLRIKEIANFGNRTISEDGDYGSIPAFYLDINIGAWDKPYKLIQIGSTGKPIASFKLKALKKAS